MPAEPIFGNFSTRGISGIDAKPMFKRLGSETGSDILFRNPTGATPITVLREGVDQGRITLQEHNRGRYFARYDTREQPVKRR